MSTSPDSQPAAPGVPQAFAGLDVGKLDDLVSSVWDHKDDVAGAVRFVRDHGDDLIALAAKLPELLASAATALGEAATDTRATASFLTGGSGGGSGGSGGAESGVKALAQQAGHALDACRSELNAARGMLEKLAEALHGVPLIGAAATTLQDGAAHFDGVGDQLAVVAEQLRSIGSLVDSAGEGLSRTADKLESGGRALSQFTPQ